MPPRFDLPPLTTKLKKYIADLPSECHDNTLLYNPKTGNCIKDTAANRKRLGVKKKCTEKSPLLNPKTGRCLKDTAANRKKLGLKETKKTKESKHRPRSDSVPLFPRESEKLVAEVFSEVEPYQRPPTPKEAENTYLASYLYKMAFGDNVSKYNLDFLDKMSLVNNDSAKWKGQTDQLFYGLLYILLRHPDTCWMKHEFTNFMGAFSFSWYSGKEPNTGPAGEDVLSRGELVVSRFPVRKTMYYTLFSEDYKGRRLSKVFKRCEALGKRFVVGFIALNISGKLFGHGNAIIYDRKKRELEVFEPHGSSDIYENDYMLRKQMYRSIETVFKKYVPVDKFHSPMDYCPKGPQYYDTDLVSMANSFMIKKKPKGYCTAWSLYYLDLRLSNPDVPPSVLVKEFSRKFWYNSVSFINAYSNFVLEIHEDLVNKPGFKNLNNHEKYDLIHRRFAQVARVRLLSARTNDRRWEKIRMK
nr:ankyrin repeat domain-containing protein [Oceanusvirus sp.]